MQVERLSVNNLGYNPEESAFQALVVLTEAGANYAYPVQVRAPITAEFGFVAQKLSEIARNMHRHAPSREMRLRRAPVPAQVVRKTLSQPEPLHPGAPLAA